MKRSSRGDEIRRLRGLARAEAVREVLSRWEGSALGRAAFCRRERIAPVTLSRWQREFGAGPQAAVEPAPAFVEALWSSAGDASLEVTLPTGARVRVPRGFDTDDLARLIAVLSSC